MRWVPTIVCAAAIALAPGGAAQAKGCIKGAVVGGVAGHFAHHPILGAAAGCAVGHHMAHKREVRERREAQARNYQSQNGAQQQQQHPR